MSLRYLQRHMMITNWDYGQSSVYRLVTRCNTDNVSLQAFSYSASCRAPPVYWRDICNSVFTFDSWTVLCITLDISQTKNILFSNKIVFILSPMRGIVFPEMLTFHYNWYIMNLWHLIILIAPSEVIFF